LSEVSVQQDVAVAAYQKAVDMSFERFKTGLSDYFEVLYAQQNLFPAQVSRSQYRYQYASTLVKLYVALGGGWNLTADQMMKGSK
jgi:multidrug efflux system outer membrane protein